MIVTYDPATLLPTATIDEPLPPGTVELYQQLQQTEGVQWFEAPEGTIFGQMVVRSGTGALSLAPQTPTPGALSSTQAKTGAPITLSGLPDPASLSVDEAVAQQVTGGSASLTFSDAGTYKLTWAANPYSANSQSVVVS